MAPESLSFSIRSQSIPTSVSTISVCSDAWRAAGFEPPVIELDESANDLERLAAVGGFELDDHVVDDRQLIAG